MTNASIRFGRRVDILHFDATIINTDRDTALRRVNRKRMTSYHIQDVAEKTPVLIREKHKNSPLVKGRQHVGTLFGIVQIFVKLVLALHDVVNDFETRQISGRLSACRTFRYLLSSVSVPWLWGSVNNAVPMRGWKIELLSNCFYPEFKRVFVTR